MGPSALSLLRSAGPCLRAHPPTGPVRTPRKAAAPPAPATLNQHPSLRAKSAPVQSRILRFQAAYSSFATSGTRSNQTAESRLTVRKRLKKAKNPQPGMRRDFADVRFSRPPHSTALPPLQGDDPRLMDRPVERRSAGHRDDGEQSLARLPEQCQSASGRRCSQRSRLAGLGWWGTLAGGAPWPVGCLSRWGTLPVGRGCVLLFQPPTLHFVK